MVDSRGRVHRPDAEHDRHRGHQPGQRHGDTDRPGTFTAATTVAAAETSNPMPATASTRLG